MKQDLVAENGQMDIIICYSHTKTLFSLSVDLRFIWLVYALQFYQLPVLGPNIIFFYLFDLYGD